jgi:transcriptional activator for dhaKLM operon
MNSYSAISPQDTTKVQFTTQPEDVLFQEWLAFVYDQQVLPDVQPVIARSWKRCWARVNPFQPVRSVHLNKDHFFSSQLASFDLLSVALPILEDVQQSAAKTSSAILFTNSAGCILELSGDEDILNQMAACGIVKGSLMTEELIGTNAVGLALTERMPVSVVGSEHYIQSLHAFGAAAAPVFDLTGHSLGVVAIITTKERFHAFALGMAISTAKAIEGQRQSEVLMNEQNTQLAELNALLSAISEGILVWNADDIIMHANLPASNLLGVSVKDLLGKSIEPFLKMQPAIKDGLHSQTPITDREVTITVEDTTVNVILSLRYVYNNNSLRWTIATLRPVKEIRQLVQHQIGASATLTLEDIPGTSTAIQHVRRLVQVAAPAKASILIHGEPGVGKNALASAIHNVSPNREGPFIIFACASIPNELALQELLGFDESFNARHNASRPSKFELAEGGTLFFQDVDALPLEAQAVLLNVLEMGVVQRLGSNRPIKVDCRIIASTARDIRKLFSQKGFRSDLYYRLSMFSITLPPLRERPQDIPENIDRILKRFSQQTGYKIRLGPGVMDALKRYPWPGNIREIESTIGRAAMQTSQNSQNSEIQINDLPSAILLETTVNIPEDGEVQLNSLDDVERETIIRTAKLCHGNVSRMAEILGISRTTLWRRLKVLKIDPDRFRRTNEPVVQSSAQA